MKNSFLPGQLLSTWKHSSGSLTLGWLKTGFSQNTVVHVCFSGIWSSTFPPQSAPKFRHAVPRYLPIKRKAYKDCSHQALYVTAKKPTKTQMYINRTRSRQSMLYPFSGILLSNKKEQTIDSFNNLEDSLRIIMLSESNKTKIIHILLFHLSKTL